MPPPPDAVLTHLDLDALLNSTTPAIPSVPLTPNPSDQPPESSSSAAGADAASGGLNTEALAAAVSQDPDAWLHAELYNMLAQCEPDVFERLSESQLVKQQGHDQIVEHLQLTRFDLCYNPGRYDSWERVLSESTYPSCCQVLSSPVSHAVHNIPFAFLARTHQHAHHQLCRSGRQHALCIYA